MRILCVLSEFQYGDAARGLGLEAAYFVPALRQEGNEVRIFDPLLRGKYHSYADLNASLLGVVEDWRPELMLCVLLDVELWSETLAAIRRHGVKTLYWATDDTWKWRKVSRFIANDYDGMITTHEGSLTCYRDIGMHQVLLSQWAAPEAALKEPIPAAQCRYRVSFVGIAYGDRMRMVQSLADAGIEVQCFGYRWPAGPVALEEIPRIMHESVISLNFSKGLYGGPNQTKARVFEVPGAGGFLLTEDSPDLSHWYSIGEEIDVFNDLPSLIERIRFYLAHPELRNLRARLGHERTRREHVYRLRMRQLLTFAQALPKPARGVCAGMENALREHTQPLALRLIRNTLVACCRIIWGRQFAAAYARRIAFEISWRLSGRRTFQARGWFGRMFPPSPTAS